MHSLTPATSFTPIFSASNDYTTTLSVGTGEFNTWPSGQNYSAFTDFNLQTFTLGVTCVTTSCGASAAGFRGAWVGTEYAPVG